MHLSALAYVSTAVRRLNADELDSILTDSREFNALEDVTGALLHHDGSFFQYVEGPSEGLSRVYERIRGSSKHKGLIQLIHTEVDQRQFSEWHMAFAEAPASTLQGLATSRWDVEISSLEGRRSTSAGLELLLAHWARAHR